MNQKKLFSTYDLGLAAALMASGFGANVVPDPTVTKKEFTFEDSAKLQKVINAFWQDTLKVPAQKYFVCIKALKNRIYSQ